MTERTSGHPIALRLAGIAGAALAALSAWHRRNRTRRQLRGLDESLLRDIGIGEADRTRECRKWFWER